MLYFPPWKTAAILLAALAICLCSVPDLLSSRTIADWPHWAQRRLVLGLDLRGGSHLLLEVDSQAVRDELTRSLRERVQRALSAVHIRPARVEVREDRVQVRLTTPSDFSRAQGALTPLAEPLGDILGRGGGRSIVITQTGDDTIALAPTQAAINARAHDAVEESIPIVERRINELGTVEPIVEREGSDRIVVEVPGLQDPTRLETLLGRTAKLTFQLVDLSVTPQQALAGERPADTEILYDGKHNPPIPYLVDKQVAVSGADLVDAQPSFDRRTGEPIVNFTLDSEGARRFADATRANVGRPFAIVLDNQVVAAPVIREPIIGGAGEISGNFTVEEANDLAILLRAGALPAPLRVIEESTVGPGLGQDSIRSGEVAALVGASFVVAFMLATYGLFGLFADVAVMVNVAMIFGLLSLISATLTLPGIAGIVLTIGIAVDSNVLIYERIREELRVGRSPITAIDAGFRRALATILDSNIATLIAASILFFIGSGPVRGFAVTLGVGIATTLFTAFTFTRLIIAWWVRLVRPHCVPI
jgi:preprotein translocase subunit SecD